MPGLSSIGLVTRLGLLGLLVLGTTGCPQELGDRCQLDSDCASGLYCELAGSTPAMGGTCRATGTSIGVDLLSSADLSGAPTDLLTIDQSDVDEAPVDGAVDAK